MPRPRVLSFISAWGGTPRDSPPTSQPGSPTAAAVPHYNANSEKIPNWKNPRLSEDGVTPSSPTQTPQRAPTSASTHSRRSSMLVTYQPPMMDLNGDTPPELAPVFTFLNNHATKLYQEGYFLKLHDLDSRGRPSADRVWNECFAQLVGTVLSLWDAAQLDAAGEDGEVVPTFINLTDASIKMIESLPMNGVNGQNLQNVLSISTAANNRYLLHFNSLHSLTQWTAGIRLAMFEHASLQEAYTGSILAGKGKHLNNIKSLMERARFPSEDWARVRFGAGTPWRRCWCVIAPPDEKQIAKAHKEAKKRSAYDKTRIVIKGEIRFYETRKITKKTRPIATIVDAYAAYAIYPQSKALIDNSTLVKVEGTIRIHSSPESTTEGFVFVMPEVHPAISGFEMMLRWLLPTYDTFALYGRPERLVATALDVRSLMFGMPAGKRYGYLDLIDVSGLIHTEGSQKWSEKQWKREMKNLTSKRMTSGPSPGARADSAMSRRAASRSSLQLPSSPNKSGASATQRGVRFGSGNASPSGTETPDSGSESPFRHPPRTDSAPAFVGSLGPNHNHNRSASDSRNYTRSGPGPAPPAHTDGLPDSDIDEKYIEVQEELVSNRSSPDYDPALSGSSYLEYPTNTINEPLKPVQQPPAFAHEGRAQPAVRPNAMPELRNANATMDAATLDQLRDAGGVQESKTSMQNGSSYPYQPAQYQPYDSSSQGPPPPVHRNMSPAGQGGPPQTQYNQRRGPPPPNHQQLPTIPGTPAHEPNQFDLPVQNGLRPTSNGSVQRDRSAGSIARKPVGGGHSPNGSAGY